MQDYALPRYHFTNFYSATQLLHKCYFINYIYFFLENIHHLHFFFFFVFYTNIFEAPATLTWKIKLFAINNFYIVSHPLIDFNTFSRY